MSSQWVKWTKDATKSPSSGTFPDASESFEPRHSPIFTQHIFQDFLINGSQQWNHPYQILMEFIYPPRRHSKLTPLSRFNLSRAGEMHGGEWSLSTTYPVSFPSASNLRVLLILLLAVTVVVSNSKFPFDFRSEGDDDEFTSSPIAH